MVKSHPRGSTKIKVYEQVIRTKIGENPTQEDQQKNKVKNINQILERQLMKMVKYPTQKGQQRAKNIN